MKSEQVFVLAFFASPKQKMKKKHLSLIKEEKYRKHKNKESMENS